MFDLNWTVIIASGDAEQIWNAIYSLVRDRNPIQIYPDGQSEQPFLGEISSDIAQEVFLRLITEDRLSYFMASGYTSEQIGSDLILHELAEVLISRMGRTIAQETNGDSRMSPSGCENLALQAAPSSK